jgi:hypothetical protein
MVLCSSHGVLSHRCPNLDVKKAGSKNMGAIAYVRTEIMKVYTLNYMNVLRHSKKHTKESLMWSGNCGSKSKGQPADM